MRFLPIILLAACAHPGPVGEVRFKNADPVWRVDDRRPQTNVPEERVHRRILYNFDTFITRRGSRAMDLDEGKAKAADVNSLGEVPDSTWFENRIGVRDYTLEELRRGPNTENPFDNKPWTITGAKVGGRAIGFTFLDARGDKYLLKFDMADAPEMETAAHIIVHRIMWAVGYHVPQDHVGLVDRADLVIGEEAKKKGFDADKLDRALKLVYHTGDGRIRVLASKFIPGKPLGSSPYEGVREDDRNDVIPHERRRSLRGAYPLFAWLSHSDIKEDNTVDTFIDGHVVHYMIDFGKALGVQNISDKTRRFGRSYRYEWGGSLGELFTFGLVKQPWDNATVPELRGVGQYTTENFDPGKWKPVHPWWPIVDRDRFDSFWGAKILIRFKPHELAAIVDEAKLSDPRSAKYLVETMILRQRETARYWFDRVAPLDAFEVVRDPHDPKAAQLCFTDLMLAYRLRDTTTLYAIDTWDFDGKQVAETRAIAARPDGRSCVGNVELAQAKDRYTIMRLRVQRDDKELSLVLHVAADAAGKLKVIGVRRR